MGIEHWPHGPPFGVAGDEVKKKKKKKMTMSMSRLSNNNMCCAGILNFCYVFQEYKKT